MIGWTISTNFDFYADSWILFLIFYFLLEEDPFKLSFDYYSVFLGDLNRPTIVEGNKVCLNAPLLTILGIVYSFPNSISKVSIESYSVGS